MEDKAWEGKLRGFSPNSRSYHIYNAEKRTIVESRNVHRNMLVSTREASRDEDEKFCEEIESMVRENVAQSNSSEDGGTSTVDTSA